MAKAPPSFQFYPGDFVMGTAHLDAEAIGCYLLLLCFQWSQGKLPNSQAVLSSMCKMDHARFAPIWDKIKDKFEEVEGEHLANHRLEVVRGKALALSEKRSTYGRKGGQAIASNLLKQNTSKGSMKSENRKLKTKDRKQKPDNVEIGAVVAHYRLHHPRSQAGDREQAKIAARLREGFSVDDLMLAIDGCHVSPFHCGQNEQGRKYQTLELIMRDASKVTQFIELAQQQGDPQLSEKSRRSLNAIGKWLEEKNG